MVRSGFRNFYFRNRFVTEMLGTTYGLSRELRVGCFVWYLQKNWTFWTKSRLFPRPSMVGFMARND